MVFIMIFNFFSLIITNRLETIKIMATTTLIIAERSNKIWAGSEIIFTIFTEGRITGPIHAFST